MQSRLDQIDINCDTLILAIEIWADEDINQTVDVIKHHPKLKNCTKIIATLGYTHFDYEHNTFAFAWNHCYNESFQFNIQQDWKIKNTGHRPCIMCLNRRDAAHRIHLGYNLFKSNLLNSIAFSQRELTVPLSSDFDSITDLHEYTNLLPIKIDSAENDHTIKNSVYEKTYFNLVTETEIELIPSTRNMPVEIVTEKSYKPFFAGQVPILLAGPGHLAYLKHFGFDMFEDLFPSNFDQMLRVEKIDAIINLIRNGDEFFEDYYFNNLSRIKHNFDLAKSRRPWTQTLSEIKEYFS